MKTTINLPDEHQYSIMQRVLDGTLAVDTVDEFKEILDIYPDDPLLQRKFADLLIKKSRLDEAVEAFDRTSRLFIDVGMNLQAIVAKILQWSIQKPTHDKGRQFQKLLSRKGAQYNPLQCFWANMSYAELIAIMTRLVRVQLPAGKKIACIDEPADDIYFVVSGTLAETISPDCQLEASKAGIETEPMLIGPNDIFGNVFPLDQPTLSYTDVEAISDVELVKISKAVLHNICCKFPNIENLLLDIYNPQNVNKCDRPWQTVRRSIRYGVPTKVELSPLPVDDHEPDFTLTGTAVDLSLGGVCVDLGAPSADPHQSFSKGQSTRISLVLLKDLEILDLSGKIVWHRKRENEKGASVLIGIRFDSMDATDHETLSIYCSGNA
ncbi:MAG: PilZ domain-containing protein [Desulfobacteraceae bacterium]|jgi:hypothetical protein